MIYWLALATVNRASTTSFSSPNAGAGSRRQLSWGLSDAAMVHLHSSAKYTDRGTKELNSHVQSGLHTLSRKLKPLCLRLLVLGTVPRFDRLAETASRFGADHNTANLPTVLPTCS